MRRIENQERILRIKHRGIEERTEWPGLETCRRVCCIERAEDELQSIIQNVSRIYLWLINAPTKVSLCPHPLAKSALKNVKL